MDKDIVERLRDLYHQATTERSHIYVGKCAIDASNEILRLREAIAHLDNHLLTARDFLRMAMPPDGSRWSKTE